MTKILYFIIFLIFGNLGKYLFIKAYNLTDKEYTFKFILDFLGMLIMYIAFYFLIGIKL